MLETELIPAPERASKHLMIVLHGLGDSMDGYRWLPAELDLPWMNYLLVNAPDPYYGGYSWFEYPGDASPGVRRSYQLLGELWQAQECQGALAAQTFWFGFSQGCLMTWEIGMRHPQRFAGLLGISGAIWHDDQLWQERSTASLEQSFLATHGTLDPVIPFPMVRDQVARMKKRGVKVSWHEFAKAHTIAGHEELDLIRQFCQQGRGIA